MMKMKNYLLLASVCMLSVLYACSNAMQLAYSKPAAIPSDKGSVSVTVIDQRIPERGGNDPLVVGIARNAFGMPFDIKASPNREPTKVVKELLSECLTASGYKVVDDSISSARLYAVVKAFWSDGYQHSRMGILMPMELKKKNDSVPVWHYDFNINTGFTWKSAGFSQFNKGFNNMLEEAKKQLLQIFQQPEFLNKVKSLS